MLTLKSADSKINKVLLFLSLGLTIFGCLMIFDASSVMAEEIFEDKFHLFRLQSFWAVTGITSMIFVSMINYHFWKKISSPLFLISVFLLVLVLIPGVGMKLLGGRRWLGIGEFSFQPAELAKLFYLIYLSTFLEKRKSFSHFIFKTGFLVVLLMMEPDLGTAVILACSAFVVYFLSGANLLEILMTLILGIVGGLGLIFNSPYRLSRLRVFLNPNIDPQGASYHLRQVLLALGSGGFWGRGLGQSRQKFLFLPEASTDSIFAVIGEEMGFVGCLGILITFLVFLFCGLKIAQKAPDKFGLLLAGGITTQIFIQAFLNLSSMVALLPLTGVPLPFISYGGSSLMVTLGSVGILLNISKFKMTSLRSPSWRLR